MAKDTENLQKKDEMFYLICYGNKNEYLASQEDNTNRAIFATR